MENGQTEVLLPGNRAIDAILCDLPVRDKEALGACGPVEALPAPTVWRMVSGFGSNPALETGLHLHPLLGFPLVPGSAIRGLVHHVAEATLGAGERAEWNANLSDDEVRDRLDERQGAVEKFLDECERVWRLFGSLHLETTAKSRAQGEAPPAPQAEEPIPTPRDLLRRWQETLRKIRPEEGLKLRQRIDGLLDTTGGRLVFYDAVPLPGQPGLLQPDILNPHYPDYYREPTGQNPGHPPSDDQDPIPVYFLAVAPGKAFEFLYRWRSFRGDPPGGHPERTEGLRRVSTWLRDGLDHWGLGGKTAAGYGYFDVPGEASEEGVPSVGGEMESPA